MMRWFLLTISLINIFKNAFPIKSDQVYFIGYIPTFDTKMLEVKNNNKCLSSVEKWKFKTCVPMVT